MSVQFNKDHSVKGFVTSEQQIQLSVKVDEVAQSDHSTTAIEGLYFNANVCCGVLQ